MAITPEGRPVGTYPLGVFHTLLRSILCTKLEVKSDLSVESVPSSARWRNAQRFALSKIHSDQQDGVVLSTTP
jgi:hypothetical protein